ncbi:sugar ABC transporter permease [Bacillus sp. FJAT-50079]|uniref:sugar ABC transporter permease n=1 Tax=Bacillus sp. FJAT-50079 TaxID=2833577 RepID=UPI001BC91BC3|nr:sugar ABC transporter permease [Bacillus sp. FJAT-50079]MBS4206647.1 sugar ABC transporter permease [Bacillus sp. FJAT-50079]
MSNAMIVNKEKPKEFKLFGKLSWKHIAIIIAIALIMGVFNHLTNGVFLSQRNVSLLLRQSAILGIVSSGMVLLIIARQIDLSAGAAVYLVSVVAGQLSVTYQLGLVPTIICAVLAGLLMGAFQGMMVAKFNIPAFIVTLAGMLIFRGIGYVWTNAATVGPVSSQFIYLSEGYISIIASFIIIFLIASIALFLTFRNAMKLKQWISFKQGFWLKALPIFFLTILAFWIFLGYQGIPMAVVIVGVGVIIMNLVMAKSKFGRNIYVIGGNPDAAKLSGVKVTKHLFTAFLVMGLIYGIAGVLMTARLGSAAPTAGQLLELDAIAAAVIGGTSLSGGIGVIPGALIGALLLSAIDNCMSLLNVSSFLQMVVKGVILLAAVWFDISIRKKK